MTHIDLPWHNDELWTETCIWAMEQFGLPGAKYQFHPLKGCMRFDFVDPRDAEFFALRWL